MGQFSLIFVLPLEHMLSRIESNVSPQAENMQKTAKSATKVADLIAVGYFVVLLLENWIKEIRIDIC